MYVCPEWLYNKQKIEQYNITEKMANILFESINHAWNLPSSAVYQVDKYISAIYDNISDAEALKNIHRLMKSQNSTISKLLSDTMATCF